LVYRSRKKLIPRTLTKNPRDPQATRDPLSKSPGNATKAIKAMRRFTKTSGAPVYSPVEIFWD
jgi:hypothetical protein